MKDTINIRFINLLQSQALGLILAQFAPADPNSQDRYYAISPDLLEVELQFCSVEYLILQRDRHGIAT